MREGGGSRGRPQASALGAERDPGPKRPSRRGTPAHRASVLNDDLLGQHDTAVRGPFLLLPLGHFTILDSWRCCSHSRGGRPQRRVPSRHYCRAEPLGAPAAILRARPASGGASHRAIGRPARPAHVTRPARSAAGQSAPAEGSPEGSGRRAAEAAGGGGGAWREPCALRSPARSALTTALGAGDGDRSPKQRKNLSF